MSEINLHNYESFLLDYFESRLTPAQVEELKAFLMLHPQIEVDLDADLPVLNAVRSEYPHKDELRHINEFLDQEILDFLEGQMNAEERISFVKKLENDPILRKEIESYQKTILIPEHLEFGFKNNLHKNEEDLVFNQPVLNYLEGELTESEKIEFENELLSNLSLSHELQQYRRTQLLPDLDIRFENKKSLKREARVVPLFARPLYRAVAAGIVFIFSLFMIYTYFFKIETSANPALSSTKPAKPNLRTKKAILIPLSTANPQVAEKKTGKRKDVNILKSPTPGQSPSLDKQLAKNKAVDQLKPENHSDLRPLSEITAFNDSSAIALAHPPINKSVSPKYTYMVPFEEESEDTSGAGKHSKKASHLAWRLITRLAKQANKMGIKSLNGQESDDHHYLLSFNSFSIEKK